MKRWIVTWMLCLAWFAPDESRAHGDLHEQIEAITRRIEQSPKNANLHHQRGEMLRAHGDHEAALADYDRAQALDRSLAAVHLSRGRTLLEVGRYQDAIDALTQFLARRPDHAHALLLRARAQALAGKLEAAERDFARCLARTVDPTPDLVLERVDNLRSLGDHARAIEVLDAAMAKLGRVATLDDAAIDVETELGRFAAALARLDRRLSRQTRRETLLAKQAEILERSGDKEGARAARIAALDAIGALPPGKRRVEATRRLEQALTAALR